MTQLTKRTGNLVASIGNAQVATFCASVRAGRQGVRVGDHDRARAADGFQFSRDRLVRRPGDPERAHLALAEQSAPGFYQDRSGALVAFHATPGYETYRGLGWYGVIVCGA